MSSLETTAKAQLGLGGTQAQVTGWFQEQLLAALSDPLFNVPKAFETWMVDRVAFSGLSVSAGQIIGFNTNAVRVYKKAAAAVDVVSSSAEVPVFDEMIPGGSMSTNGIVRVTLVGDYLNNSGGASNFTLRVKIGGSAVFGTVFAGISSTGRRSPQRVIFEFVNNGSPTTNFCQGEWWYSSFDSTSGSVAGSYATTAPLLFSSGSTAIDTTEVVDISVTAQHSVSSAQISFRIQNFMIEFL